MVVGVATEDWKPQCPKCGSSDVVRAGWKYAKKYSEKYGRSIRAQRYQCKKCGHITIEPKWIIKGGQA